MNYPKPHNPDKLDPIPGYRFLGINETLKTTDEAWWGFSSGWLITEYPGTTPAAMVVTTYRRALNVDDQYAPPPDQWVQPGWVVDPNPIDPNTYIGTSGMEYWANGSKVWWPTLNRLSSPFYVRRPASWVNPPYNSSMNTSAPSMNTSSIQSKPRPRLDQIIAINVHSNSILSRTVQDLAFEAGFEWGDVGKHHQHLNKPRICLWTDGTLAYHEGELVNMTGWETLDAHTDLGRFVEILEATKSPMPPKIGGSDGKVYEGKFTKGGDVVEFGCAKIAVNLILRPALILMLSGGTGNRGVQSITLSSGVSLNRDEIKEIIDYVEAINKG